MTTSYLEPSCACLLIESVQSSSYQHVNTYVLKTYRFKDAKDYYEAELSVFKGLMVQESLAKNVIGFYGSYEQNGLYSILLEYADVGTLEDYLQRTSSPTTGNDIYLFWRSLFNVINGLRSIHDVQGKDESDPQVLAGHVTLIAVVVA